MLTDQTTIRFRGVTPYHRHTKHLAAFCPKAKAKGANDADTVAAVIVRAQVYAKADNRVALDAMRDSFSARHNLLADLVAREQATDTDKALATVYGALCSYLRTL